MRTLLEVALRRERKILRVDKWTESLLNASFIMILYVTVQFEEMTRNSTSKDTRFSRHCNLKGSAHAQFTHF
jgi:hypothetical protein